MTIELKDSWETRELATDRVAELTLILNLCAAVLSNLLTSHRLKIVEYNINPSSG